MARIVRIAVNVWQALVELLEDLEDAAEFKRARQEEDILLDWEEVLAKALDSVPERAD